MKPDYSFIAEQGKRAPVIPDESGQVALKEIEIPFDLGFKHASHTPPYKSPPAYPDSEPSSDELHHICDRMSRACDDR